MIVRWTLWGRCAALVALSLSACAKPTPDISEPGGQITECALGGADVFAATCYLFLSADPADTRTIIRHPDGGFRVFEQGKTLSGYIPADGAIPAIEVVDGAHVVIMIGNDRYRFDRRRPHG